MKAGETRVLDPDANYHHSLTGDQVLSILDAKAHWTEWAEAEKKRETLGLAMRGSSRCGFAVVVAYDLELQTGVPHCSCCLRPVAPHATRT